MNTAEFVALWKNHAEELYRDYISGDGETAVSKLFNSLSLDENGKHTVNKLIETIIIDTHYSFLMGLAGCANIGGVQQDYKLFAEDGSRIYEPGDLEAEAYEQFQENFMK